MTSRRSSVMLGFMGRISRALRFAYWPLWRRSCFWCFFFQAEDGIRDTSVTGVQTCALPIYVKLAAVQGVVKERGRNLAAGDSPQLAGALKLSEGEGLKEGLGGRVEGLDAAHRKEIGRASCRERV